MITKLFKLFHKKNKLPEGMPKVNGFYIDKNTIGEQSKTVWSEFTKDVDGTLIRIEIERPQFPSDRIEIH